MPVKAGRRQPLTIVIRDAPLIEMLSKHPDRASDQSLPSFAGNLLRRRLGLPQVPHISASRPRSGRHMEILLRDHELNQAIADAKPDPDIPYCRWVCRELRDELRTR